MIGELEKMIFLARPKMALAIYVGNKLDGNGGNLVGMGSLYSQH